MHIVNLLEHLPPELIPFILKDLSNQDLKNCRSINAPSIRDFRRERFNIFSNLVRKNWDYHPKIRLKF